MEYFLTSLISFIIGWFCSYLFQKYVSIEIKIKKQGEVSSNNKKIYTDIRLQKINKLLIEIKKNGKLPIKIPKAVEKNLLIIANTPRWEKQLDEDTINTLLKLYNSWERHINADKYNETNKGAKLGDLEGYKRPYWSGSYSDYLKAVEDGKITPDTEVVIYDDEENNKDYRGSWIVQNEDGSVTEYMD